MTHGLCKWAQRFDFGHWLVKCDLTASAASLKSQSCVSPCRTALWWGQCCQPFYHCGGLTWAWLTLGGWPGAHQVAFSLPLISRTGGENMMKKLVGWGNDREITQQLLSWAELDLGNINLIYCKLLRVGYWEIKTELKTPSSHCCFSPGSTHSWRLSSPSPGRAGG